jgi:hypothetical protein
MRILKMLWLASFPLFVLVHTLVYAQYEGLYVYLSFDSLGNPQTVLHKNTYFNLVLGLMVLVNIFSLILGNLPPYMPKDLILTPQKKLWLSSAKNSAIFFTNFNHWAKGLGLIANLFFAWMVVLIYSVNIKQFFDLSWMIYLFLLSVVVWIGSFFYIFSLSPEKLKS